MKRYPDDKTLQKWFSSLTKFPVNKFHPLVWIVGEPIIGESVYIGGFSEVNAKGAKVIIGNFCDIASFVSINCADTHLKCIGLRNKVVRENITIEDYVFVGSHTVIKGGVHIGHHSVIASGTVVDSGYIPPYSLVSGNPMLIKSEYYLNKNKK